MSDDNLKRIAINNYILASSLCRKFTSRGEVIMKQNVVCRTIGVSAAKNTPSFALLKYLSVSVQF